MWDRLPRPAPKCDHHDGHVDLGPMSREPLPPDHHCQCQHEAVEVVYSNTDLKIARNVPRWLCACHVAEFEAEGKIRRNPKRRRDPEWKCPQ